MKTAINLIKEERQRQLSLGYTRSQDDMYVKNAMAEAAAVYLLQCSNLIVAEKLQKELNWDISPSNINYKRNLIKGGALVVAELERLIRSEEDLK